MTIPEQCTQFREDFIRMRGELAKVIVGQQEVVEGVLTALMAGGHVLLEGVPGLGKTLLVRTLSQISDLQFSRIQFTPDLMPADITGTNLVTEDESGRRGFEFQPGPVFANIVLADEINRATPKTQSAMLEAMQERSVTVGGVVRQLDDPYVVLATQNPLEMEGTYPLPEAQLDRFLLKLLVSSPGIAAANDSRSPERTADCVRTTRSAVPSGLRAFRRARNPRAEATGLLSFGPFRTRNRRARFDAIALARHHHRLPAGATSLGGAIPSRAGWRPWTAPPHLHADHHQQGLQPRRGRHIGLSCGERDHLVDHGFHVSFRPGTRNLRHGGGLFLLLEAADDVGETILSPSRESTELHAAAKSSSVEGNSLG